MKLASVKPERSNHWNGVPSLNHGVKPPCRCVTQRLYGRSPTVLLPPTMIVGSIVSFIFNHCPSLAGEALYWADLDDYYCGTNCLDTRLRLLNAAPKTREVHQRLLRLLYQKCDEPYDEGRLPTKTSEHLTSGARHIQGLSLIHI